jgi:hypothetical protein
MNATTVPNKLPATACVDQALYNAWFNLWFLSEIGEKCFTCECPVRGL